jgi:hypothetical protein
VTDFKLVTESDRARFLGVVAGLDLTKPKTVTIKEKDRSGDQNRALHAMLADISRQVEHYGKKFDVETWKRMCTAAWLREEGEQAQLIPALDGNGFDVVFVHTSKLNMKQCASLITWVEAYGTQAGVRWTQPDRWDGRY